uniref:Uncharacterized protein n=1 Tax=Ditylenchus dipsaci TaxID=166011 RepID=A0A915D8T2_9BILA
MTVCYPRYCKATFTYCDSASDSDYLCEHESRRQRRRCSHTVTPSDTTRLRHTYVNTRVHILRLRLRRRLRTTSDSDYLCEHEVHYPPPLRLRLRLTSDYLCEHECSHTPTSTSTRLHLRLRLPM